jgi:hypothetical protein
METEMRNVENTADVRSLTEIELDGVSGGHPAIAVVPAIALAAELIIGYWDLPFGMSVQEAAGKAGVGHLM